MHDEPCACGNNRPWLTEGRTDDILIFENGVKIPPLSLYIVLKEIHGIQRFQLIQVSGNELELRLIAENKVQAFEEAKKAVTEYLLQNGVICEICCSDKQPEANAKSGKFKHIVAMKQ